MATYTSNYGLHQWAPEDNFLRTDFNEDLKKIDDQLGTIQIQFQEEDRKINQRCKLLTGTFTGTGSGTVDVSLGTTPKLVFIYASLYSGICSEAYHTNYLTVTEDGISMEFNANYNTNLLNRLYHYFAFCDG